MKLTSKIITGVTTLTVFAAVTTFTMWPAANADDMKESVRQVLLENPDILYQVIRENPRDFLVALQQASDAVQQEAALEKKKQEQAEFEAAFENPLKPEIRADEAIRGTPNAPLVLVEYSDFQCPYCYRGYQTVMKLLEKYDGNIQFVYKHLPLDFHAEALISAYYYEAVRMQSNDLAFKFHDALFDNVKRLKEGEVFLKEVAQKVGADMALLEKTLKERKGEINQRIEQDIAEARQFGMSGTPGFLLNGIPLRGAYPMAKFEAVIKELQDRKLAKL